jgi:hypothetical protein
VVNDIYGTTMDDEGAVTPTRFALDQTGNVLVLLLLLAGHVLVAILPIALIVYIAINV